MLSGKCATELNATFRVWTLDPSIRSGPKLSNNLRRVQHSWGESEDISVRFINMVKIFIHQNSQNLFSFWFIPRIFFEKMHRYYQSAVISEKNVQSFYCNFFLNGQRNKVVQNLSEFLTFFSSASTFASHMIHWGYDPFLKATHFVYKEM